MTLWIAEAQGAKQQEYHCHSGLELRQNSLKGAGL